MKRYSVFFAISYKTHYAFCVECRHRPTVRWIKRVALKRTDLPKDVVVCSCQNPTAGHFYVKGFPVGYYNYPKITCMGEVIYNG